MSERENNIGYPTNWVSKNDLIFSRPDLVEKINQLDENDMLTIAKMIGDAIAETHDMAIDEMLSDYFGIKDTDLGRESSTGKTSRQD